MALGYFFPKFVVLDVKFFWVLCSYLVGAGGVKESYGNGSPTFEAMRIPCLLVFWSDFCSQPSELLEVTTICCCD